MWTRWLALGAGAALLSSAPQAQAPVRARITGIIWDSVTMRPMRSATVRIVRADDPAVGRSATTDVTGSFRFDSVPAGTWLASYLHPVLDSVRIEPAILHHKGQGGTARVGADQSARGVEGHDASVVHDRNAVAQPLRFFHIVRR